MSLLRSLHSLLITSICAFFIAGSTLASPLDGLTLITESYPPFNMEADGNLQGIAVDLLDEILKQTESKLSVQDVQLIPWAHGYTMLKSKPNICLFSTTRTKERENLFNWVGPIAPTVVALIARKDSNIKIGSTDDLNKYKIGVVKKDVGEALLLSAGVNESSIKGAASVDINIRKLLLGKIDMVSYEENVTKWKIKNSNIDPNLFETVHVLKEGELYYALSKEASQETVSALQSALNEVRGRGEAYQAIMDKYLN